MNQNDLKELKGKVKSVEDLRKVLDAKKISYTEESLKEAYANLDDSLTDAELDQVSGGAFVDNGPAYKVDKKCKYCKTKVRIWDDGEYHPCPNCGKMIKAC